MMRKIFTVFTAVLICVAATVAAHAAMIRLVDGHVYKDGEQLDCEVYKMPAGIENGIEGWAVIDTETSGSITEEEAGVWFFGLESDFKVPLDSACQGVEWNPAGDRFVLVQGSEARADVFFRLWYLGEEGALEKEGPEFAGVRGSLAWFPDGTRFAFTRIDDTRDTKDGVFSVWALKLSAVLYDSTEGGESVTVLKEATDTQNFWFDSVSEDGKKIVLREDYVKSPKDWGDEEKIERREITVPVPARRRMKTK